MFTALHVANNVLKRAHNEKIRVTPMKLQKLIYFVYREYLKRTGFPLFAERFEAWQYGPVLNSVYDYFKNYETNGIQDYYKTNDFRVFMVSEDDEEFKNLLDGVWNKYKHYDGIELSKMTHQKDTAWYNAIKYSMRFLSDEDIINEEAHI